ncbi:MAG: hypothetical protein GX601_07740 [Anaerolineales bacterium]|nr:hypothetical protein [Anaerolineales bacterium]
MARISCRSLPGVAACLLVVLALLLGVLEPAESAPASLPNSLQGTLVSIEPEMVTVAVGVTATLDVRITGVTNLNRMELYMTYDPSMLEVVDANASAPGTQIGLGPFLHPSAAQVNFVNPQYGEIDFLQQAPGAPVSGGGVVARITVRGKAEGVSYVGFDAALLFDDEGIAITITTADSRVTVVGEVSTTTTSTPIATSVSGAEDGTSFPSPVMTPSPAGEEQGEFTPGPEGTEPAAASPTPTAMGASPIATPTPLPRVTVVPAQDIRVLQVWPDRVLDVLSGHVVSPTTPLIQPFVFGIYDTSIPDAFDGGVVYGRTYLHFPMDVFPPGTDIRQATLYVPVDSATSEGLATFGLYRVLENWDERVASTDPDQWPQCLPTPIALTEASIRFRARAAALAEPALGQTETISTTQQASPTPNPTRTSTPRPSPTVRSPGLATPTGMPLSTRTPTPIRVGPRATAEITLTEVISTVVTWDATALLRAWFSGDVPNHGLAIGPGPALDSAPALAGNVLAASWPVTDHRRSQPYLVVQIEVRPVTPTPTLIFCLPAAGSSATSGNRSALSALLVGLALVLAGLAAYRRRQER